MTSNHKSPAAGRIVALALLFASAAALPGCSQDFASVDDVYVPRTGQERFPIEVVERPVKLNVPARSGKLSSEDARRLAGFAAAARQHPSSPVYVTFPSGSNKARGVSQQVIKTLASQGIPRSMIRASSYGGKSDVVSLSFTRKVAATKECGDWSKNLGENGMNEPYPNFGCTLQNNFAAMAANPEDFERPRSMGSADADGQMPVMDRYQSGAWTTPVKAPDIGN